MGDIQKTEYHAQNIKVLKNVLMEANNEITEKEGRWIALRLLEGDSSIKNSIYNII